MASYKMTYAGNSFPVTYRVKNNSGTTVFTQSSSNARMSVADSVINALIGNITFETTDNLGVVSSHVIDKVSLSLFKTYWKGFTTPNGEFSAHISDINLSVTKGFNYIGVVYDTEGDAANDAALLSLDDIEYDHTTFHDTYSKGFDQVVSHAYANNVKLRISISLIRKLGVVPDQGTVNNGTTITLFYSNEEDVAKRADGTPTWNEQDSQKFVVGSFASVNYFDFANRLMVAFCKRYKMAFNDGTILGAGFVSKTTAEFEFLENVKNANGSSGPSYGDYHVNMVNGFKTKFPQYSGESAASISANVQSNNNELVQKWRWYQEDVKRRFLWQIIDNVNAIPGFERTKWLQDDRGTYVDAGGFGRGNANAPRVHHPSTIIVKSNDNVAQSQEFINFAMDQLSGQARDVSAMAFLEPSPPGTPSDQPLSQGVRDALVYSINYCKARAISISFFHRQIDEVLSTTGIMSIPSPVGPPEYVTEGGNLILNKFSYNLSTLYAEGGYYNFISQYVSYLDTQDIAMARITTIDNIDPLL